MSRNAKLLMAMLMLTAVGRAAVAGQFEDAFAAYNSQDYATAYRLFRPLADSGNAGAAAAVGVMYAKGQGVPQNDAEAVRWYRLARDRTRLSIDLMVGCSKRAAIQTRNRSGG